MILQLIFEIFFWIGTGLMIPLTYAYFMEDAFVWYPLSICVMILMMGGLPIYLKNILVSLKNIIWGYFFSPDKRGVNLNISKNILTLDFMANKIKDLRPKKSEIIIASALCYLLIPLITVIFYHPEVVSNSLTTILSPFFGFFPELENSIPIIPSHGISFEDAVFESYSGWTSTGLTVLTIENYSPSFKFFRTMTQWIGGMGIVLFALLVLKGPAAGKMYLLEGKRDIGETYASMARKIWMIYTFITIFGALALFLSGFTWFESLNYSMTSVATGGFAIHNSTAFFSNIQKLIIAGIMLLGATSFAIYFDVIKFNFLKLFNSETLFLYILAILGTFAIFYTNLDLIQDQLNINGEPMFEFSENDPSIRFFVDSFAISVSSFSTCGFQPLDLERVSEFAKFISFLLMVIGGSFGSTAGGLKIWRVFAVLKHIKNKVFETFTNKKIVLAVKMGEYTVTKNMLLEFSTYFFMYGLLICICSGFLMIVGHFNGMQEDYTMVNSTFLSASILGNVGLSPLDMSSAPAITKYVASFFMFAGRIEIFPILVIINFIKNILFNRTGE